jgi:hypothetical protein
MSNIDGSNEVTKLQQHLVLLREEYVKLQQRYKTLERNYNVLNSTTKIDQNSFVCRLLKIVADLFNRELYRFERKLSCSSNYFILVILPLNLMVKLYTVIDLFYPHEVLNGIHNN